MNWTLDTEDQRIKVFDADELRRRLMDLHVLAKQKPVIVMLNAPDGSCLAIGLGRELSVLNYMAPGGWPAKHVLGDEANQGLVDFTCFGQLSETPARYAVPFPEALDAAAEFFTSGQLTEKLEWMSD